MNMEDILPDKWREVHRYRRELFNDDTLKNTFRLVQENCSKCYGNRILYLDNYMLSACIFNKCIKRYPHKLDNKEFT